MFRSIGRSEPPPLQQACICSPGAALKGAAICLQEMSTPHGVIRHFFDFVFLGIGNAVPGMGYKLERGCSPSMRKTLSSVHGTQRRGSTPAGARLEEIMVTL